MKSVSFNFSEYAIITVSFTELLFQHSRIVFCKKQTKTKPTNNPNQPTNQEAKS